MPLHTTSEQAPSGIELMTEEELSARVKIPVKTLQKWRCAGMGFPYIKFGRGRSCLVRYDFSEVKKHLEGLRRVPSVRASVEEMRGTQ